MRTIITTCIVSVGLTVCGQATYSTGEVTDVRDGKTYKTVTINNTTWLAESMKYTTPNSSDAAGNEAGIVTDGYYYLYHESDDICPDGFEIPKESDWKEYVDFLLEQKGISKSQVEHFKHNRKKVKGVAMRINDDRFSLFEEDNPLNIRENGMVQGDNFVSDGAFNIWSRMDNSDDTKYHLHIEKKEYGNHSHKHHIITRKKKKRRKFAVRCVKRSES